MPILEKKRTIKRPKFVPMATKRVLRRLTYDKIMSNARYAKLKSNNIALARALNKQKQEAQYLDRVNRNLTVQNHDLQLLRNRHVAAFSGILKSSKEAMDLMVKATEKIVHVISACNDLSKPEASASSRVSLTTPNKRESGKHSSPNKSPARGVVQPMVSGHAIAQPAITLSRIRITAAPNVSDIEELPEASPVNTGTRTHPRISPTHSSRSMNRSVAPLMPQRIRISSPRIQAEPRTPDENRRHPNRRSSRYQKRKSRNSTRHSSEQISQDSISIDATIRSPRVSLEDVSRLMQNSHSINVRNLMELASEDGPIVEDSERISLPPPRPSSPTYGFDEKARKNRRKAKEAKEKAELADSTKRRITGSSSYEDDPLEGTSWSHNNGSSVALTRVSTNESLSISNGNCLENCMRAGENLSATSRMSLTMVNHENGHAEYDNDDHVDDDDDDDEVCRVINVNQPNDSDEDKTTFTTLIARNVCTSRRGCSREPDDFDPDDFTLMPGPQRKHEPWTMADLPTIEPLILENPLPRVEFTPEPEMTRTIQINAGAPQQLRQSVNPDILPNVTVNTSVAMPFIDTAGRESEDETTCIFPAGRRRINKPVLESSSESDSSSPPQSQNVSIRRRVEKRRDPSSAKVVLEKLKEANGRKRQSSPDSRRSVVDNYMPRTTSSSFPAPNSDSESSNTSVGSKQSSGRPRRQKAPVYLGEPSIIKKLRR